MDQSTATNSGRLKPTNPKDRIATSRIGLDLFPDTAIAGGALAMTEGDLKYGAYNYRILGVQASVYYAAARRHMAAWWNGEDNDPDTLVPHLYSALGCIAVLIDSMSCGVLNDNRPPKAPVGPMQRNLQDRVELLQAMFPDPPDRYTEIPACQAQEQPNETDASVDKDSVPSAAAVPHGVFIRTGSVSP